jgi:anti-sigma28 factor (negative regulator of flagellin synthesis)
MIPFSNLQRRSYSVSSPSSSQRKSNHFHRSDSKGPTKSNIHFSDVHNSQHFSHDDKQKRSHSTNSYRQTRGNTDTSQFPEPYVHYIPSTTSIKNNKKIKSNSNNGQHNNSPAPPRASTPVKLLSSELNISKTQNRLMALVLDRIEKLKQRITEVSPAEVLPLCIYSSLHLL